MTNALDQIFGWLIIAFGVAQSVTNFRIQSSSHLTLSLSGTAVAIIVAGFLNFSHSARTRCFRRISMILSSGNASTVCPTPVTVVARNSEL